MNSPENSPARRITLICLAAVGFIALVGAGVWLAIYSTRFVPNIVNGAGEAAVQFGAWFMPNHKSDSSLSTASTTISFGTSATSTSSNQTTPSKQVSTTAGEKTSDVYQISGTTTPSLYGFPDLIVNINATGYLTTSSTDSFVATSTIHSNNRPAISFTIKNIGTNATGLWRFSASIPTQNAYIYQSQLQQSLNPGESIDYILGFDQPNTGVDKTISITANSDNSVRESHTDNNSSSVKITILGN